MQPSQPSANFEWPFHPYDLPSPEDYEEHCSPHYEIPAYLEDAESDADVIENEEFYDSDDDRYDLRFSEPRNRLVTSFSLANGRRNGKISAVTNRKPWLFCWKALASRHGMESEAKGDDESSHANASFWRKVS